MSKFSIPARRAAEPIAPEPALRQAELREAALRYAEAARGWAGPRVTGAADFSRTYRTAATAAAPKVALAVTGAMAASKPFRDEAMIRGTAALAALRGEIAAPPAPEKRRTGRVAVVAVSAAGAAAAGWRAWLAKKSEADWQQWSAAAPSTGTTGGFSSATTTPVSADAGGAGPDEALAETTIDPLDVPMDGGLTSSEPTSLDAADSPFGETRRNDSGLS